MEFIVWTGRPLRVTVNPGAPGKWPGEHVRRDVYAVGYEGGDTQVLVVDDAGRLTWLGPNHYSAPVPPVRVRD